MIYPQFEVKNKTYYVQMSIFHFLDKMEHFLQILKWKFSFQNLLLETLLFRSPLRNNQRFFNILRGFAHRLGQSLHLWKIAPLNYFVDYISGSSRDKKPTRATLVLLSELTEKKNKTKHHFTSQTNHIPIKTKPSRPPPPPLPDGRTVWSESLPVT